MSEEMFEGNLQEIDPKLLIDPKKDDKVGNFFLVLALIFNDFKGLVQMHVLFTSNFKPSGSEPTPHNGEYNGLKIQIYKIILATMHELFEFIQEHQEIFGTTKFLLILKNMPNQYRQDWTDLVEIARGKNLVGSDFRKILVWVRNNVAFHYYQADKVMAAGFRDHFFNQPVKKESGNLRAYYSPGKTMQDTRFYYADAAISSGLFKMMAASSISTSQQHEDFMIEILKKISGSLYSLLREYIKLL